LKRKRPMRLIRARFCSKEIIISDNWPLPRNIGLRDVRISDLCVMVLRYSNCLYLSTANKYGTSVRRSTDKIWQLLKKLHRNFLEIYGNFPPTLENEKFLMYRSPICRDTGIYQSKTTVQKRRFWSFFDQSDHFGLQGVGCCNFAATFAAEQWQFIFGHLCRVDTDMNTHQTQTSKQELVNLHIFEFLIQPEVRKFSQSSFL
jgi:hypothetical protein